MGRALGRVAVDDLRRELQAEDTTVRVAISTLEQVGLLQRWPDIPRSATLRLGRALPEAADLEAFCRAARLVPGQALQRDLLDVAQAAGLDARMLEERVLSWTESGSLEYRSSERDLLLEVPQPPKDARARLQSLLEQYETIQQQRVAEIVAYANSRRCRHGHISTYLGGRAITECQSCDNCLPLTVKLAAITVPDECTQLQTVLRAAAHGWGQRNLIRILRGEATAPEAARHRPWFGALSFRSATAIRHMIEGLIEAGFLQTCKLERGVALRLTPAGRQALDDSTTLRPLAPKPPEQVIQPATKRDRQTKASVPVDVSRVPDDDPLLQSLLAWRTATAREAGVPAFMVAHNALLRNIAAARPRTESELLAIKGMGPRKLEKYGAELLRLVSGETRQ